MYLNGGYAIFATPKLGEVFVHRYVWHLYNGQIPDGYVVHHKNGNKLCNCICNLELMTREEHISLHHTGKVVSPETRAKHAVVHRRENLSQETLDKMSSSHRREALSPESRQHISEGAKRKAPPSAETRAKLRAARARQVVSPETLAKRSQSLKGHKLSPETIAKRQATRRANDLRLGRRQVQ